MVVGLQDFIVSPSPLGTNCVFELIGTCLGLGLEGLGTELDIYHHYHIHRKYHFLEALFKVSVAISCRSFMKLLSLQLSQLQLTVTQLQMSTVSTFQQSVVTHQTIHLPARKLTTLNKISCEKIWLKRVVLGVILSSGMIQSVG